MEWTKEEMEALYVQMQKKAMTDEDFRKEILEDANKALAKLAGKDLPQGMKIKVIEQDPDYTATFVLPDLVSEETDLEELEKVAGGVSLVLVVSGCGVAVSVGPCAGDGCGVNAG